MLFCTPILNEYVFYISAMHTRLMHLRIMLEFSKMATHIMIIWSRINLPHQVWQSYHNWIDENDHAWAWRDYWYCCNTASLRITCDVCKYNLQGIGTPEKWQYIYCQFWSDRKHRRYVSGYERTNLVSKHRGCGSWGSGYADECLPRRSVRDLPRSGSQVSKTI